MTTQAPLVTQRIPEGADPQTCAGTFGCAMGDVVALVLGAALLLFVLVLATAAHVRSARSIATDERERVRNEAKAFRDFARQIDDLDAGPSGTGGRAVGASTMVETATASSLGEVERAYRETIMSVPHYEAEYDEPLARNMAAEFGEDVASAVVTGQALTPRLKGTLLQRSGRSHRLRVALLDHLDAEADELAEAEADYDRIAASIERIEADGIEDGSFEELLGEWYLMEDREQECVERLRDRQETVQSRRGLAKHISGAPTMEEYLYAPLDVTYPVLADGASLLEEIRSLQREILLALASAGRD